MLQVAILTMDPSARGSKMKMVCACVCMRVCNSMHACLRACVRACGRVCAHVCICDLVYYYFCMYLLLIVTAMVPVEQAVLDDLMELEAKYTSMLIKVKDEFDFQTCDRLRRFLAEFIEDSTFYAQKYCVFRLLLLYINVFDIRVLRTAVERLQKTALKPIDEYDKDKMLFLSSTTVREFEKTIRRRLRPEFVDHHELIELKIPSKNLLFRRTLEDLQRLVCYVFALGSKVIIQIATMGNFPCRTPTFRVVGRGLVKEFMLPVPVSTTQLYLYSFLIFM